MKFFNFKPNKDLIKPLKESKQDFRFDRERVKNRLLLSIRQAPALAPARTYFTFRFFAYAASGALMVIFISATFTFASNSKPGDRLFALNKLGEKVILSLPLSMEQKAQVHADIVTRRLEALLEIEDITASNELEIKQPDANPLEIKQSEIKQPEAQQPEEVKQPEIKQLEAKKPKTKKPESEIKQPEAQQPEAQSPKIKQLETKQLETIKESDETIKDAIETVTKDKQRLESSGQKAKAEKLGKVLNQIDDLAKKHEDRIKTLEASLSDRNDQAAIDEHLKGIKKSRQKAMVELKIDDNPEN